MQPVGVKNVEIRPSTSSGLTSEKCAVSQLWARSRVCDGDGALSSEGVGDKYASYFFSSIAQRVTAICRRLTAV